MARGKRARPGAPEDLPQAEAAETKRARPAAPEEAQLNELAAAEAPPFNNVDRREVMADVARRWVQLNTVLETARQL